MGEVLECGDRRVTEEEFVEFARRYDPQPFHLDDAAAESVAKALLSQVPLTLGSLLGPRERDA